jgi:hypothetical protein
MLRTLHVVRQPQELQRRWIRNDKSSEMRMSSVPEPDQQTRRGASAKREARTRITLRSSAVVASLVALLTLSGCGGGGDAGGVSFDIGVVVGGQPVHVVVQPGGVQGISIAAGQSIEFDASEPVQWTLEVGGSAVTGSGTTVYYQGVSITQTALSSSRIALDTSAAFPLAIAVPIRLTAVSTFDSALVATINVLITN